MNNLLRPSKKKLIKVIELKKIVTLLSFFKTYVNMNGFYRC